MRNKNALKGAALWSAPLGTLAVATMISCMDAPGGTAPRTGAVGADAAIVGQQSAARRRLSESNPQDWVGKAHNKALGRIRAEIRKPGLMTTNMCQYLDQFLSRDEFVPSSARKRDMRLQRAAGRAGSASAGFCRGAHVPLKAKATPTALTAAVQDDYSLSADAQSLAGQLLTAINEAIDQNELATRLLPVLDASHTLNASEQTVIAAAVSTAQHSWEYWETELAGFADDVVAEYSDCAAATGSDGFSTCVEGGDVGVTSAPMLFRGATARFAARAAVTECVKLSSGFKRLIGADAIGGIIGAVKGIVGGPATIGAAAFAGAAYASLGSFLDTTWKMEMCALGYR